MTKSTACSGKSQPSPSHKEHYFGTSFMLGPLPNIADKYKTGNGSSPQEYNGR